MITVLATLQEDLSFILNTNMTGTLVPRDKTTLFSLSWKSDPQVTHSLTCRQNIIHITNVKFELNKCSPYSVPSAVTVAYLSLEA